MATSLTLNGRTYPLDGRLAEIALFLITYRDEIADPSQVKLEFNCAGRTVKMVMQRMYSRDDLNASDTST